MLSIVHQVARSLMHTREGILVSTRKVWAKGKPDALATGWGKMPRLRDGAGYPGYGDLYLKYAN